MSPFWFELARRDGIPGLFRAALSASPDLFLGVTCALTRRPRSFSLRSRPSDSWVRCSAQVWNEISDFEYVGKVLIRICDQLRDGSWKTVEFS